MLVAGIKYFAVKSTVSWLPGSSRRENVVSRPREFANESCTVGIPGKSSLSELREFVVQVDDRRL